MTLLSARMAVVAAFLGLAAAHPKDFVVGQSVQTFSGPVQGHAAPEAPEVSEYLGIPYAKPPVGDLRWAPPQVFNGTAQINAAKFVTIPTVASMGNYSADGITDQGAEVMVSLLGQGTDTFDEDCLTLNVWTKPQTGEAQKAVLFWIYGGGFNGGATDIPGYNGKYIADQEDVVVVSANYRLNIFGFPGNPNITNNLGLLDQRLATEWVRDNIAAFGGDPNRITIFGQSAGADSVDYYSYAWTEDPIVAGFIPESGSVFVPGSQAQPAASAASWYNVSANMGCGDSTTDPTALLACMRSKSWQDVQNAMPALSGAAAVSGNFGPTIDEVVVFSDYLQRSAAGNFIKRPMLIGNNNYEAGLFAAVFALQNITYTQAEWEALGFTILNCPVSYRALAGVVNKVPTWRYRWFGDFPNLKLSYNPDSGAWHGAEVPIVFGTDMDIQNKVARTPEEEAISKYVRGAWATFAKDPVSGLTQYGFPAYNPLTSSLMQLAINNQTGPNPALSAVYDTGCPVATLLEDLLSAL